MGFLIKTSLQLLHLVFQLRWKNVWKWQTTFLNKPRKTLTCLLKTNGNYTLLGQIWGGFIFCLPFKLLFVSLDFIEHQKVNTRNESLDVKDTLQFISLIDLLRRFWNLKLKVIKALGNHGTNYFNGRWYEKAVPNEISWFMWSNW